MANAELLARLTLDKSKYDKGLQEAEKRATTFGKVGKAAGAAMKAGLVATAAAATAVGGAMTVAVSKSQAYSRQFSNINSILQLNTKESAKLKAEILDFAGRTPQGITEVADAYYDIVSGVADASKHMAILEAAQATATGGQANLKATTAGLISVMNSYSFGAQKAGYVSDVFTKTVQTGVTTMDQLASALPKVTGLSSEFGVGLDHVAAQLAFMTTKGATAAEASTRLRQIFVELAKPAAALEEALANAGYESGRAALEMDTIQQVIRNLADTNDITKIFGSVEALQGALAIASDESVDFASNFLESIDGATDSAQKAQEGALSFDMLRSKLEATAVKFGDRLLPIVYKFVDEGLLPLINKIEGPALDAFDNFLTKAVIPLMGAVGHTDNEGLRGNMILGAVTIGGIGVAALTAMNPILGLTAAITGLIAAWVNFRRVFETDTAQQAQGVYQHAVTSGAKTLKEARDIAWQATVDEFSGLGPAGDAVARVVFQTMILPHLESKEFRATLTPTAMGFETPAQVRRNWHTQAEIEQFRAESGGYKLGDIIPPKPNQMWTTGPPGGWDIIPPKPNQAWTTGYPGPRPGAYSSQAGGGSPSMRAAGGSVSAGMAYRVNEEGQEYFRPYSSGEIMPVGRGRGGATFNVTINTSGGYQSGVEAAMGFERKLRTMMQMAG